MSGLARMRRFSGQWPFATAARGAALLLTLLATVVVAGCSASGGTSGINFSLGLQGSTADNPAQPPAIASTGPDGEYAFVYDNQVWAHLKGGSGAVQVTRLTLSNGATIVWGPLVWSPSGKSLAFALVVNDSNNQITGETGPIYYADLSTCLSKTGATCPVYNTESTGSVYGHTYAWLDDEWLISGGGGGISAFDIGDPNGWRTWQLRRTVHEQQDNNCGLMSSYGDVQVVGSTLYYTCMNISSVGGSGVIGSAMLNAASLSPVINAFSFDQVTRDQQIAAIMNYDQLYSYQVNSLGNIYGGVGGVIAGAWTISGTALAFEHIGGVDTKTGTVSFNLCSTNIFSGGCGSNPLPAAKSQPLTTHPQIRFGPRGAIAYQSDALYMTGQKASLAASSPFAPVWLSSSSLVATQVVSTTTDASGVTRVSANLIIAQGGTQTTMIAGASDFAMH